MSIGIVEYVKEWCRMQRCPTAIDIAMELDRGFQKFHTESHMAPEDYGSDVSVENPAANIEARQVRLNRVLNRQPVTTDASGSSNPSVSAGSTESASLSHKEPHVRADMVEEALSTIARGRRTSLGLLGPRDRHTSFAFNFPSYEVGNNHRDVSQLRERRYSLDSAQGQSKTRPIMIHSESKSMRTVDSHNGSV